MKRKPVQLAVRPGNEDWNPVVYALCDDGTIWSLLDGVGGGWQELPDIPQPVPSGRKMAAQ